MAEIENRSMRTYDITALTGKDGKPGAVYSIPHKHRETGAPGTGEIPDAVLRDLLEHDPFTVGAFATGNDLVDVSKGGASVTHAHDTTESGGDRGAGNKGGKK